MAPYDTIVGIGIVFVCTKAFINTICMRAPLTVAAAASAASALLPLIEFLSGKDSIYIIIMKVSSIVLALLAASSNLVFGVAKKHKNLFDASTSTKKKKPKKPKKPKQDKDDEGPPFSPEIFYILAGIQALTPVVNEHETPIASRFASYYDATNWNCVAAFSGSYMDSLTKLRPSVTSPDTASHTTKNRAVCLTQATASLSDLFFGGIDAYLAAMEQFEELVIEEEVPTSMKDCLATVSNSRRNLRLGKRHLSAVDTCLGEIALQANYDPTTMGHVIAVQTYAYALSDGFLIKNRSQRSVRQPNYHP
eukprot:scaffold7310_cov140-Skeletonema_marinoi.AAC.1